MFRFLRILFLVVTGLVLLTLALANRGSVPVRWLPEELAGVAGLGAVHEIPLFLVILGAVAAGVLIGFVWEWFRERRIRGDARLKAREVARLERELAELRSYEATPPQDEVLALLEPTRR